MEFLAFLPNLFALDVLGAVFVGVLIGILVGAVPGLNGAVGISLLLPLTFALPPEVGLLLLGGIYMGCMYGGSITAILINVPGDVFAAPAAMEGFPLTAQGRSKEALYYSIFSSMIGGVVGIMVLILFTPPLARFALQFGPAEMFFVAMSGLIIVGALSGSLWKAAFAVAFGLWLSTIGLDQISGADQFTFGERDLRSGISVVPVVLGLFCIAEMIGNIGKRASDLVQYTDQQITRREVLGEMTRHKTLLAKGSLIGTFIGLLPGVGTTLAVFMSYAEARRTSKNPEKFENGSVEGIMGAESANNATVGSSLVPLLALGVPGSPTTAIIAGALVVHGIILGPSLFVNRPDVAFVFLYGMLLTVVAMGLIGAFGIKYFAYILKIRMDFIIPTILVLALFGGQDDFSDDLLAFAESAGISCKAVPRLKGVMPGLYMSRLHQGERGFSYWRGQSAARLMMQDVDLVARQVQEADVIYVSGITLAILPPEGRSALIAVMAAARKASKFVVFDPNIRPALWEDATTLCATLMTVAATSSLVLPSFDDEMAAFGDLGPEETVARYRSAGAGQVVVKNGPAAVVTWDGANLARHETPILPGPLIDSTAAGDSFNAAFLAQILRSDEIASAVRAGQALASRVVQGRGALIETPRIITGVDR